MIAREPLTPELLAELRPLILANHDATGRPSPLDPDWIGLADLERGDALCLIVARSAGGQAVGYVAHLMINHPLYRERWAQCVAVYLDPAHRALARALVSQAEEMAKGAGAAVVTYSVPRASRAAAFLHAIGYPCMEQVMAKRVG